MPTRRLSKPESRSDGFRAVVPCYCLCVTQPRNAEYAWSCRLAFVAVLHLDRDVTPAPHEVTSTTATGVSGPHGGAVFTTTHWSVVLEAQGESPAAQEALEKLCRTYWRPIFAFLRRQGAWANRGGRHHPGFFCRAIGAQKSRSGAQGKGTTSFLSAWGTKILSRQRGTAGDGDQARKRTTAYPIG